MNCTCRPHSKWTDDPHYICPACEAQLEQARITFERQEASNSAAKADPREDAKQLRYYAASLTYNDTKAEGEAKHRLHEIAMRIETGYYCKPFIAEETKASLLSAADREMYCQARVVGFDLLMALKMAVQSTPPRYASPWVALAERAITKAERLFT